MSQKNVPSSKVLIISNQETTTGFLVSYSLENENYKVFTENKPLNAFRRWAEVIPDLIVLDINYPVGLIVQVASRLRESTSVPIILLTRAIDEDEQNQVYTSGVDDCIFKPLGPTIFLAKIRAWLRVSHPTPEQTFPPLRVEGIQLVPEGRQLILTGGSSIDLTNLEFHLLYSLMSRPRHDVPREQIARDVWGEEFAGDAAMIKNLVYRLRHKLKESSSAELIHNHPRTGYMFMPPLDDRT